MTTTEIIDKNIDMVKLLKQLAGRIDEVEDKIKAYIRRPNLDDVLGKGWDKDGPLAGIPVSIKDNICVSGEPTTCASKILAGFRPPYDAEVITRLKNAGAVIWGRTNMDEFAFGSSTENSCYGPTANPRNPKYVPGGSSGGSAAAVAAGETVLSLGSDTGGSIRQPAAFCGVVGLKPTYGRVSRYGLVAFASSLDQIGPLAQDVRGCAMLFNVIAGYDPKDSTSADVSVMDWVACLGRDIRGMKIGLPKEYFGEGLSPEVEQAVKDTISKLKARGAEFAEVSLPHTEYAVPVYYIVATAEASSNLARFDGVQYGVRSSELGARSLIDMYKRTRGQGFGAEAKRRIILGTYVLSSGYYEAYYRRAQKVRTLIKKDFDDALSRLDCLITPTSPTAAFRMGEKTKDPLSMYLSDVYTISANLAGAPAISLPCGVDKNNLPIGIQAIARPFDEETLFRVGFAIEQCMKS